MMDDPGSENVDAVNTSDSVLADQTMDPEASVISTEEVSVISIEEAPVTSIEEASIISTEESTALADIKGTDGAASEDQNSANLVESSKYVSSDNQTGDIPSASEVVASKSATHYDNLYVKIQGRTINKLCSDDPEGMKAALRGLFRQWELESQPTCLVVPPVFCYNRNTEIFVLMQSKDDKTKALKSELCQSSNHKFTIKDVTLGRNIKKNIDDEEALDNLFPLRHMETYTDQTDYKLEMVKNAVAAVSFDELMKVPGSVSRKKCPTLFKKEFHLPPHITKVHAKLQDESVAVRVYLERCSGSSEVVAGIRATQPDGSYSFIPIEKCKHILKPIIELTQMFVKFMNDNKEVEPYDYNKKSGLICWLEMTSYPSFHSGSNGPKQNPEEEKVERQVLMTLALPYCTKTEELLPVDKLLNPTSLKSMIEAAKMTECLRDPPEAAGSCEDYKNTLRLGSLAGSAPDIFDFDFVQANSQLAAVKGYLDRFRSSLVDLANALELKEYEGSLGIDITWHHVSQCPVEWNRRSKLFYHHSGPVQSTLEGQAAGIVLDHRSRPGRPSMSNWYMLNKMLHKQLKFPQTHLIAFCQHASVINSLIKVCKFLTVADPDFQKSMLSLFEQKYSERIFLLDRDQGNLEKAITRAKSAPADIIVWRKGHEYMLKYPPHPFLEELVKRGLKTMVVVLDKVNVSPSAKDHNLQEELKFFTRRIFPRMVLTKVTTVDCVPGHHYVSVILKYKRNGALPELGLFPPSSTSNQPKKSLRGSLAKRAKLAVAGGGGNVAHSVDPPSNKRTENRLSQRQRLAAARRPTSSQQRRPGAVHPPSSQQRRPGALQPPSSQQRRSGALQPPSSQQRRSGALQPPSSQQRRSGALQPPSSQQRRSGALQPPSSQQRRSGALQPPSSQQRRPGALQSPRSQQRRPGALQPPNTQQRRPGALKTPSSQQRRPGVLQTPSSQQQWRPGALQSSNSQQRRPGALQPTSSQSTDVFQTINEIVNTQTRLQELMSLLASSGVLPSAQPSLEHGLTAFGVPQQRGMSSLDDDLIQEARPRRPDRRLGYNPRADWREETWLLPGSSEGGRGRKRRSEMPNDEPRRPKQTATGIDAYGPPPPAWDPREQTSSGRSQYRMERAMQHDGQFGNYEDDDDSSYESLKIETVSVKSESSDRSNSYEMTPRRNWDIPHSQFVEKYEDMSGYGSASNYQQGWYRNQSGTSVEQEDLRRRRYPEDSHGFRESHPTSLESEPRGVHYGRSTSSHPTNANVTQHGAGVSSSNVHQYGNMSMFGHSSYNPYSYAGDDGWKN